MENQNLSFPEAVQILREYADESESWYSHSVTVSQVATLIAEALDQSGHVVDVLFCQTAALLHDIGRYKNRDPLEHSWYGYLLLLDLGYPNHARICMTHTLKGKPIKKVLDISRVPTETLNTILETFGDYEMSLSDDEYLTFC